MAVWWNVGLYAVINKVINKVSIKRGQTIFIGHRWRLCCQPAPPSPKIKTAVQAQAQWQRRMMKPRLLDQAVTSASVRADRSLGVDRENNSRICCALLRIWRRCINSGPPVNKWRNKFRQNVKSQGLCAAGTDHTRQARLGSCLPSKVLHDNKESPSYNIWLSWTWSNLESRNWKIDCLHHTLCYCFHSKLQLHFFPRMFLFHF